MKLNVLGRQKSEFKDSLSIGHPAIAIEGLKKN